MMADGGEDGIGEEEEARGPAFGVLEVETDDWLTGLLPEQTSMYPGANRPSYK